jgi:hypothetical protein
MQSVAATTRPAGMLYPAFPRRRGTTIAKLAGLMAVSAIGVAISGAVMLTATILMISSLFG